VTTRDLLREALRRKRLLDAFEAKVQPTGRPTEAARQGTVAKLSAALGVRPEEIS
jgi:hypothetical protein